jgi:uncharacterized protein VirK/YbjX
VDGIKIFELSFIIAPGWVVKSNSEEILLITCLQGTPGSNPQIKLVLKTLHEYSPRRLLLAAMEGIAYALGIREIAAVCATKQRSYSEELSALFKNSYDDFFLKVGMAKTAKGFYFSLTPIEGKPLELFKERQRKPALARRATRNQVRSACASFLLRATAPVVNSCSNLVCFPLETAPTEPQPSPVSSSKTDHDLTV